MLALRPPTIFPSEKSPLLAVSRGCLRQPYSDGVRRLALCRGGACNRLIFRLLKIKRSAGWYVNSYVSMGIIDLRDPPRRTYVLPCPVTKVGNYDDLRSSRQELRGEGRDWVTLPTVKNVLFLPAFRTSCPEGSVSEKKLCGAPNDDF